MWLDDPNRNWSLIGVLDDEDNWDDDFASIISPSALQFPFRTKEERPSALLSSADRLKTFASNDGTDENWDDSFEPELTIQSQGPLGKSFGSLANPGLSNNIVVEPDDDPMQTIRPYVARRQSEPAPTSTHTIKPPAKILPSESEGRLKPNWGPKRLVLPSRKLSRPPSVFREDPSEDYSDLAPVSEDFFAQKVDLMRKDASLSPRLFHPSDLKTLPRSAHSSQNNSLRRQLAIGDTGEEVHKMRRSRSSLEIQRFAEAEGDEDYSDIFGGDDVTDDAGSETSNDEQNLMLNTKLSNNSWVCVRNSRLAYTR
jgi:hypothetical protein